MSSVYYYGLSLLEEKRKNVAEQLRTLKEAELEHIVKNRPALNEDTIEPAALGLFGSEKDPVIKVCAALDILKERRGELYAYSLIANYNSYPINNLKVKAGKVLAIGVPIISMSLGMINAYNNPIDPELSHYLAMGGLNSVLSLMYGCYLYVSGREEGMQKLKDEMEKKSLLPPKCSK